MSFGVEEWKPVVEFPDHYAISSRGRVMRVKAWNGTQAGRILTPVIDKDGYHKYTLTKDSMPKTRLGHRLVAEAFLGEAPVGRNLVLHKDGTRYNNVVSNLRWGNNSENVQDMRAHGTNYFLNKQRCPKGHEYTTENTYIQKPGKRSCLTCRKTWDKNRKR